MTDLQKLEQRLNQEKNRYGLVGAKRARVLEFADAKNEITAHINPENWEIEVILKTGYNPIQDEFQKKYADAKNITDGLETMVLHIGSLHEVAHWELPFGSKRGCPFDIYNHDKIVEGTKKGLPKDKESFANYLANAFEDTIINPRCREYNGDFSGQVLFWDKEGLKCEKEKGKKGFTPLYEAFVRVNMHLWGDTFDKSFIERHYTENQKVKKVVQEIINGLNFEENILDTSPLFEKGRWQKMAEIYAREMSELLDEVPPEKLSAFDSEEDNPLKIKTSKFFFDGDGFHFAYPNQPLTIEFKQKIQRKSFPDFKLVVIDNSGSMRLNSKNESASSGEPKNIGSSSFIPWGDGSKYHFALMGYYGIENFLQNQGIAPYIGHGVSLFSSGTRFKKGSYNELIETRKLLLSPDWGSTNLDAKILEQALDGPESFMLSISDGDVFNWSSEKAKIKKLIEQNYYAHIQLGPETAMTRDLKSWGIPVFSVNSGEDLSKLMVDITKNAYNPFIKEVKK